MMEPQAKVPTAADAKRASWLWQTMLLSNIMLLSLFAFGQFRFGSLAAMRAYARGHHVLADTYTKSLGPIPVGKSKTVSFRLSNTSRRPITLIGAARSCTCTTASALPLTIPPSGSVEVAVNASARAPGKYSTDVRFFTDDSRDAELALAVRWRGVKGDAEPVEN